ncbi:hypothetical protein A2881_04350 [Candidatus Peribacteria bacterium RIFCSPHIGHO2_01_FULL_55_13]|nr:MAG: hypothetical protein A2881_04350 [Candidatus Peribacteria bacterium RIFCSPHIGHO2_01_FULL_55_13]OGJ65050.1 MAG: hypothetical protein A3F36_01215 [Candidatus Peribacteria bacterium RIFCSPHIGHO2_12_FULL_55_11]
MFIVIFLLGFLPLLLAGWLAVRALEGKSSVLTHLERLTYGAVIGPVLVTEIVFLLNITNVLRLNLLAYLISLLIVIMPLGFLEWKKRRSSESFESPVLSSVEGSESSKKPLSKRTIVILSLLGVWLLLKSLAGFTILLGDPSYNDDVFDNWHYRAKILHHEQMLVIDQENPGVTAYPPTVPMLKVWFALVNGGWNEQLAGMFSPLWYLLALALAWCALRRSVGRNWAIVGVYLLSSIPLLWMHGFTPYVDLFVAIHLAVAVLPLFHSLESSSEKDRSAWLRIGALGAALLPMIKNETLLMHLPPVLLLAAGVILWSLMKGKLTIRSARSPVIAYGAIVAAILLPWLLYKWSNNLTFGNAKGIGGMELVWQQNVLKSLFITWTLEANFLLLPGLLLGLLIVRFKKAFLSPAVVLTAFTLIVLCGILGIFLFTGLSAEALQQTGSARGVVQLIPLIVILVTVLMADGYRALLKRQS